MSKAILIIVFLICSFSNNLFAKEPIRVAIIDTGLDLEDPRFKSHLCKSGHKDLTGEGIKDTHGHGTFIAGTIIQYAKNSNYCLVILKFFPTNYKSYLNIARAIEESNRQGNKIVNISGGGTELIEDEYLAIKNSKSLFIVAAGNNNQNLDLYNNHFYPASYKLKNILPIGNINDDGSRADTSNYASFVIRKEKGQDVYSTGIHNGLAKMSGSSISTAIATGKYIYETYH